MPVVFRRTGWVNGTYVPPTTYCPMDGPDWAKGEMMGEAKRQPQRDDDGDDEWYAEQRRERALRALKGNQEAPVAAPAKSATEIVEAWIAAHAAEGVSRAKAIADLRARDKTGLVSRWIREFNAAHGR